jgi:DNA invertase Pin-like site-specific DNA recombinase
VAASRGSSHPDDRPSGAASRANGTRFGRPKKVDDSEHIATAKRMKVDGHAAKDIAKYLGVSRATLYRYLADEAVA